MDHSFFITLILRGMGWSVTASLLLVCSFDAFSGFNWLTDLDCRAHHLTFSRSDPSTSFTTSRKCDLCQIFYSRPQASCSFPGCQTDIDNVPWLLQFKPV